VSEPLIKLLPYQRAWLADPARFKIAMVARQCGKTKFMGALEVVEDCLAAEARGERSRWIWLSRGERQAIEAVEEGLKPLCKIYGAAFEAAEYEWSDGGPKYKASEIVFPGGSRVTALPANPDTARGFTANVVLDEFAFHRDSRAIWRALFPVISRNGLKLRVLSTPNGKNNKFYELMTSADRGWSRHRVDIYQAVAQGLDRNIDELREACGDQDAWEQEFELKWLDEGSSWLDFDLITACEDADAGDPAKYAGGFCYAGNDIAASGSDLWIFWVLEAVGDVFWTREIRTLRRASFAEQDAAMAELMAAYRIVRCGMDQTGMGEKPVEDAGRRYPGRIEGVVFTPASKLAIATIGKQAFEDRKVRIPAGDSILRADLHKPRRVTGPTGIPRLVAERDGAGHADRFWALMLALAAGDAARYPAPDIFVGDDDGDDFDEAAAYARRRGLGA
jgi:phage FluMu gp28-like protein